MALCRGVEVASKLRPPQCREDLRSPQLMVLASHQLFVRENPSEGVAAIVEEEAMMKFREEIGSEYHVKLGKRVTLF